MYHLRHHQCIRPTLFDGQFSCRTASLLTIFTPVHLGNIVNASSEFFFTSKSITKFSWQKVNAFWFFYKMCTLWQTGRYLKWNIKRQNGEACIGKMNPSFCYISSRIFSKWEKWWPKYGSYHTYAYMGATHLCYCNLTKISHTLQCSSPVLYIFDIWLATVDMLRGAYIWYDSGWFWNSNFLRKTKQRIFVKLILKKKNILQTWLQEYTHCVVKMNLKLQMSLLYWMRCSLMPHFLRMQNILFWSSL